MPAETNWIKFFLFNFLTAIFFPYAGTGQVSSYFDSDDAIPDSNLIQINSPHRQAKLKKNQKFLQRLQCFYPFDPEASYSLVLCADIPDNNDPDRVAVKKEPGHVFIILSKSFADTSQPATSLVFGFYPIRPASSVFFKNVRSIIMNNSGREYNASIELQLNAEEFEKAQQQVITLSERKYNLNKYNCYDYALDLFNSIAGSNVLPKTYVKYPFIYGRGGSPCSLYRDLEKLKEKDSVWASAISFGLFYAPESCNN